MEGRWVAGDSVRACVRVPAGVKYLSPFVQFHDLLEDFIYFTARLHISVHLQVTGNITPAFSSSPNFPASCCAGFQVKESHSSPRSTKQKNIEVRQAPCFLGCVQTGRVHACSFERCVF